MEYLHIIISFFIILTSLLVATSLNPITSVLYLILTFFNAGVLLLFFNVDFLGLIFIIIYVGAIAVLFLFVVMMILNKYHSKKLSLLNQKVKYLIFIFFSLFFFSLFYFCFILMDSTFVTTSLFDFNTFFLIDFFNNIDILGQVLFNFYLIFFLLAGMLLLLALLGSILLTINFEKKKYNQSSNKQLIRSDNSLYYILSI